MKKSSRNSFFLSLRSNMSLLLLHLLSHDTWNLGYFSNKRRKNPSLPFSVNSVEECSGLSTKTSFEFLHRSRLRHRAQALHGWCWWSQGSSSSFNHFFLRNEKKCFVNPEKEKWKRVINCIPKFYKSIVNLECNIIFYWLAFHIWRNIIRGGVNDFMTTLLKS